MRTERLIEQDHTFLETNDDIFFCVAGNLHSKEAIFGMPYYFLTEELEKIMDITINEFIIIDGRKFSKLLSQVPLEEYSLFIKDNYPEYYYSPPMWEVLMKVDRTKVRRVFDPRSFVRRIREEYLINPDEENALLYTLRQMQEYDATLISNVGIAGSTLLLQDPEKIGKDIDLVVYKRSNIQAAKDFSIAMRRLNPRFSSLEGEKLQQYVEGKANQYRGSREALFRLTAGRWDTIFVDDIKVDFTFVDDRGIHHIPSYDIPATEPVSIRAKIIGISDSYFLPTVLEIEHKEFHKVIITARGYICLFQPKDVINISGFVHRQPDSETGILMVDDLKGLISRCQR